MVLPANWQIKVHANTNYAAAPEYINQLSPAWFDPDNGDPVAQGGRQAAWYMSAEFGQAVLRQYRRGGLRAKFGKESYFWFGAAKVRAFAEVRVLDYLRQHSLLVPEPIAAAYNKQGPFYKNAILIRLIPNARTLAADLSNIDPEAVFRAIKAMHAVGVWHADLNANNIMCDAANNIWLIDFDRARIGAVSTAQAENNLQRLQRSLLKIAGAEGARWWQKFISYKS